MSKPSYHFFVFVHEFGADWGVWQKHPTADLGSGRVWIDEDRGEPSPEAAKATADAICQSIIDANKKLAEGER